MGTLVPPPPPRAEKVRLERAKDERKERQRWIFPSNLPMNAAFYSVENTSEVVDHLI